MNDNKSKIVAAVRARAAAAAPAAAPAAAAAAAPADDAYDRAQERVERKRAKISRDLASNVDAEVEAQFCAEVNWIGEEMRRVAALEDRLARVQALCGLQREFESVRIALTILWIDAARAEQTAD